MIQDPLDSQYAAQPFTIAIFTTCHSYALLCSSSPNRFPKLLYEEATLRCMLLEPFSLFLDLLYASQASLSNMYAEATKVVRFPVHTGEDVY
jgi:hypothetical protein